MGTAGKKALPALVVIARSNENTAIRCCAIGALGSTGVGDESVSEVLTDLTKSNDRDIKNSAAKALSFLKKQTKER
jgi:HEAT repeat protein